jgi:hypothetical protein
MDMLGNLAQGVEVGLTWHKLGLGLLGCWRGTSSGANRATPMVARKLPTNEAVPESASASPARPCCAIG